MLSIVGNIATLKGGMMSMSISWMEDLIPIAISVTSILVLIFTWLSRNKIPTYRRWLRFVQCVIFLYIGIAYGLYALDYITGYFSFARSLRMAYLLLLLSFASDRFILWRLA